MTCIQSRKIKVIGIEGNIAPTGAADACGSRYTSIERRVINAF